MKKKMLIIYIYIFTFLLIITGCKQSSVETPITTQPAINVVEDMYNAISDDNTNAYMDSILPENRRKPNMFGLFSAISIGFGPVSIDLSELADISVSKLDLNIVFNTDDYALVQAEGKIRYEAFMVELDFCDLHDVRLYSDGEWYVDVYAPEREVRLDNILTEQQNDLMFMSHNTYSESSDNLFDDFFSSLEEGLNLCDY